jgi:uncharacterized protein (TIGR03000 family)
MYQASRMLRHGLACAALLGCVLAARGGETAVIVVRVPADAELYFDAFRCKTGGTVREFETPPLASGKKYGYRVRAVWTDRGAEVSRETRAVVRAGETIKVDILRLPTPEAEKLPVPPKPVSAEKTKPEPGKQLESEKKPLPQKKPEPAKAPEAEEQPRPAKKPASGKKPIPEKKPVSEKPAAPLLSIPEKKPETKKAPTPPAPILHPSLRLVMPELLTLQSGQTKLLPIKVLRTGLEGPVHVTFEALPPGVTLKEIFIAAGKDRGYVEGAATKGAAPQEADVSVTAKAGSIRQRSVLKIKIGR